MLIMLRRIISIIFILWSILFDGIYFSSGQEKLVQNSKNCLWKVQSRKNAVYILGSLHLLRKENYPLNETIEKAFNDAEKLVLETYIDSLTLPGTQRTMLMKSLMDSGKTLRESLSEKSYILAKKRSEELGIKIDNFNQFKPWFFALTITTLKLQQLGFEPQYGIDKYFFDKAKKMNKEIIGLEKIAFQLDLFTNMADEIQDLMLLQTLKYLEVIEQEINKIVTSWTSGNTKVLEDILLESYQEYPKIYDKLVIERNKNWLPKIQRFLEQEENYLVVVGAGHLFGSDGLIKLLEQQGYSVEQL